MKILRVTQNLYPEVPGGGSYHVHAMSRDQGRAGHDVTVVTVSDDDSLARWEPRNHYTVVRCRPTTTAIGNDLSLGVAQYLASTTGFDVIHAHSHLYFSSNLAALKRSLGDTPLAVTNHGLYSQSAPAWLFDFYLRTIGRWTFNVADVVFCYTGSDKRRLRDIGVTSDVAVVPNGIDTERFTPNGPTSNRIETNDRVVLFVGRLVEGKRPQDAIDILERLPPDVQLVFVGRGPKRDALERRAARRGVADRVRFLGHVEYDAMPRAYRSADVLLLPSRAEGLPRTVLEAQSSGVPVVASDLDQVAPAVERYGETAPVGNVTALADSTQRVLADQATDSDQRVQVQPWCETVEKTTEVLASLCLSRDTRAP